MILFEEIGLLLRQSLEPVELNHLSRRVEGKEWE